MVLPSSQHLGWPCWIRPAFCLQSCPSASPDMGGPLTTRAARCPAAHKDSNLVSGNRPPSFRIIIFSSIYLQSFFTYSFKNSSQFSAELHWVPPNQLSSSDYFSYYIFIISLNKLHISAVPFIFCHGCKGVPALFNAIFHEVSIFIPTKVNYLQIMPYIADGLQQFQLAVTVPHLSFLPHHVPCFSAEIDLASF